MNRIIFSVVILTACFTVSITRANPQTTQQNLVTLQGRVVDARTGEGIAKVRVIGGEQSMTTDEKGEFTLENLTIGQLDLYITTVNYGLVKKTITLKDGENRGI